MRIRYDADLSLSLSTQSTHDNRMIEYDKRRNTVWRYSRLTSPFNGQLNQANPGIHHPLKFAKNTFRCICSLKAFLKPQVLLQSRSRLELQKISS